MKLRPIIAASVLLAAFAASALPVSATQETTAAAIEAGNKIAAENLIDIQSDEAAIALNIVNSANNGSVPNIIYNDDASIRTIQGAVSGNVIRNEKDAAAALKNVSALFGIQDFDKELVFDSVNGEDFIAYAFQQKYQGVKVQSGYVTLVVDAATKKAIYLNNTFAADLDLDIAPVITAEQAGRIAANELGITEYAAPELVIFQTETGAYRLAWDVKGTETGAVIDAKDGEVLQKVTPNGYSYADTYTYNDSVVNPVTKSKNFTVNVEHSNNYGDGDYHLHDKTRNIWVTAPMNNAYYADALMQSTYAQYANSPYSVTYFWNHPNLFETENLWWLQEKVSTKQYNNWKSNTNDKVTVGVLYQIEKVYDYYKNVHSRQGTNGSNMALVVNPLATGRSGEAFGACASQYGNMLQFSYDTVNGQTVYEASALDIVAHEYTHRVSESIVHWARSSSYGETACLDEGYGDIMGEYAEAYIRGTLDWKAGATLFPSNSQYIRDLTYMGAGPYHGQLYRYTSASQMNNTECHTGSTIISHCAYRMYNYGIPTSLGRKIWYSSLSFLPTGDNVAKFSDARAAVIYVASFLIDQYTSNANTRLDYKAKVRMAFNAVNVKVSSEKVGDVDRNGVVNRNDTNLLSQFIVGNANLDVMARACADANYDGKITTADRDKINNAINNGTQNSL